MSKNAPDVTVKYVIKDTSEWKEFLDSVCRSYGFDKKSCPIVYTLEGTLIGSGSDFVEHVRERYEKTLTITKEAQKGRTKLNIAENDDRMRRKQEGDTIGEKLEKALNKINPSETSYQIDDSFYATELEKGIPFFVRRANFMRPEPAKKDWNFGRLMDIPDEVMIR